MRPILALVLATLAGGCSKVETKRLLPWFETRTRQTRTIGPVSVGSNGTTPYVRRFGLFWTEVPGCLDGEVLDADTVAVSCSDRFNRGTALLRRGETEARPACGTYASFSQILPDRALRRRLHDRARRQRPVVPTRLRYWRVAPSRETLFDTTLAMDEPGRMFVGPGAALLRRPHARLLRRRGRGLPAAARLRALRVEAGASRGSRPHPSCGRVDCAEAPLWSQRTGRDPSVTAGRA